MNKKLTETQPSASPGAVEGKYGSYTDKRLSPYPTEDIKHEILNELESSSSSWSSIVNRVSRKLDINPVYVERTMGDLVKSGKVKRKQSSGGFPQYATMKEEEKPKSFSERRKALEGEPSKSGTYGVDPWHEDIKGPRAV